MLYLSSDPHFGHSRIIEYVNRPFKNIEEMDETLIHNFNNIVKKNDTLYILGDFTMGGSYTKCMRYREKLNCEHIHLIFGNHDKKNIDYFHNIDGPVFSSAHDYQEIEFNDIKICLSHYPFLSWNGRNRGSIMCHGHIHSNRRYNEINQWQNIKRYDVGVDANDYKPVSIEKIVNYFYPILAVFNDQV